MTTPSPDGFSKMAKSWINLKRYQDKAQQGLFVHFRAENPFLFLFFFFLTPQPAQLVPEPSVRHRDIPVHQNHDRGPQHRLVLTLSQEVLTAAPLSGAPTLSSQTVQSHSPSQLGDAKIEFSSTCCRWKCKRKNHFSFNFKLTENHLSVSDLRPKPILLPSLSFTT